MHRLPIGFVLAALVALGIVGFVGRSVFEPLTAWAVPAAEGALGLSDARHAISAVASADAESPPSPSSSPSASPGDVTPPVTAASGVDGRWHARAVTIRFTATDDSSGVAGTYYSLDGGDWIPGSELTVGAPADHANDGEHALLFLSIDNAGNREVEQRAVVRIDTTPPEVTWVGVSPGVLRRVEPVELRFVVREVSGTVEISYRVTDQYGKLAVRRGGIEREAGAREVEVSPRYKGGGAFIPGLYRVALTATDEAGNVTTTKARPFRNYRSAEARVWRRVSGAGKRVALTFDDGNAAAWRSMLDTLEAHGARATFFPLGSYAAASPNLVRRTLSEGHAVGSHGWTHRLMTTQSIGEVQRELRRSESPWWEAARGTPVPYGRPPYGAYNRSTVAAFGGVGYTRVIMWDVDPQDWRNPGVSVIASRVLSHVRSGSIVVMHLRPQTAAALPAILRGLKARGYKAVSLPELFRAAGYR